MSISTIPGDTTEPVSKRSHLERADSMEDVYFRVKKRGVEKALSFDPDIVGKLAKINAEIDDVLSRGSENSQFAVESEVSGIMQIDRTAVDTDVDLGPADITSLDWEDVNDTEPGIPADCSGSSDCGDLIPVTLDEYGNRVFDLDNSWYEKKQGE